METKTKAFRLVIGVAPGYFHSNGENGSPERAAEIVAGKWQTIAEKVFKDTGVYVSAVISPGRAVYSTNWGCPRGGEFVAIVEGTTNPEFTILMDWENAVVTMAKQLKKSLHQSTVTLELFDVSNFIYLKDEG